MFDPYLQWLEIPKSQRPITYYRLLNLDASHTAADAVDAAAEAAAERVREHEVSPRGEAAARLLKEIEQARLVLRNPIKRWEYDERLRKAEPVVAEVEVEVEEEAPKSVNKKSGKKRPEKEAKKAPVLLFVALASAWCLGGVILRYVHQEFQTGASEPGLLLRVVSGPLVGVVEFTRDIGLKIFRLHSV